MMRTNRDRAVSAAHGLFPIKTSVTGDRTDVPAPLATLIGKT